ncbi:MAG: hypothetical protein P4L76_18025 [Beijerinckiaceae bacterium]|nr:hypothetical protein [Beijerinckiaceae bacterium]
MTDTPTDKKLSERFAEARDAKVFSGALLDEVQATLRLSESHPSAIREAVEGEREACAKIHDAEVERLERQIVENDSYLDSLGQHGRYSSSNNFCRDKISQHKLWAAAIRARGEKK